MTTVDVTKLACAFIAKFKLYLTQQKYVVDPCLDEVIYYFSKYKMATTLIDCLEYEDKCDITNVTSTLTETGNQSCLNIKSCAELVDINITQQSTICSYTVGLFDDLGNATAFPKLRIQNNTIYQNAYITVKAIGCNETYSHEAETGCVGTGTPVCAATYDVFATISYRIKNPELNSSGYVKYLRVYQTDASGIEDPTPIDLNLSPSNLSAWTSCGLCSGISAGDLYFGSANWAAAFKLLLENVSYTLHGAITGDWVVTFKDSGVGAGITIANRIKHNPTSEWLGINRNDFRLVWVNNLVQELRVTNPSINVSSQNAFISDDFSLATTCGNITGKIYTLGGTIGLNSGLCNYNFLSVSNPQLTLPATLANLTLPADCTKTTLTASYTTDEAVTQTEWLDPTDTFITNDLSITVTEEGIYTFVVDLDNGCTNEAFSNVTDSLDYTALITEQNDIIITTEDGKYIII